ncbi:MAG: hypothetical protein A2787_02570 [Omnitrophica WOR_2 bacterium RIFCSPHIGHO2_01_FULL_48_9]|nr:MAG: hypothetical protein A3D10_08370 [Omnitrophica WOR_2 bacterium RIFCSPHIGHO2_02_FULL_48_11]OGX33201.1 MAG: hypothetical protein A2787_02570 [Omnitrophica WOR_2 bacterium RIFCSPHIGHO2_01_FULL_48_9]
MAFPEINFVAVVVAAVAYFVLGWVWYSPEVFGKAWMKELKISAKDIKKEKMGICLLGTFLTEILAAVVLMAIIKGSFATTPFAGANVGLLAAIGFVAPATLASYLYEDRSVRLFCITVGYHTVALVTMGTILGGWR